MQLTSKIVYYPQATLADLDAGVRVAFPLPAGGCKYYAVPSFLIIGPPRCGTTAVRDWLAVHPNLRTMPFEGHFFDEVWDLNKEWPRYVRNHAFLLSKRQDHVLTQQHMHTFEKTPGYFSKSNQGLPIPAYVHRMLPSGKFIVLLRNPTHRFYSAYQLKSRALQCRAAEAACLTHEFTSFVQQAVDEGPSSLSHQVLLVGHYAEHLARWLQYFKREQFLIVWTEDFTRDPVKVMEKILNFLRQPYFDYQALMQKDADGFWKLHGHVAQSNIKPYPPMSPAAKQLLDAHYAPWNAKLRQLLPELSFNW